MSDLLTSPIGQRRSLTIRPRAAELPQRADVAVVGAGLIGLSVVVEGVETPAELQTLAACGLPTIQGYVFCKPMPATDVPGWTQAQWPQRLAALRAQLGTTEAPEDRHIPAKATSWMQPQGEGR